MYLISDVLNFPSVNETTSEGILAVGGDLSSERLLLAYKSGIFPWFNPGEPILWWAPSSRMVLFFEDLIISKSMRNILNRNFLKLLLIKILKRLFPTVGPLKERGKMELGLATK